jgi:branched-chain amino acid transport system permease protein
METLAVSLLNGVSYGLLLFMLSSGLTLIFSMMGVLNFAHAAFYMLGAYLGYALSAHLGFLSALFLVPLATGLLGAAFERHVLRRVHPLGHVPELLVTFGLGLVLHELVQLVWGTGPVNYRVPSWLDGPLFTLYGTQFPLYRAFIMAVALAVLALLGLMLRHSRLGLVVQAALTHPQAVQALGHDVPRVFMAVFGVGSGLAGLAGVLGNAACSAASCASRSASSSSIVSWNIWRCSAFMASLLAPNFQRFRRASSKLTFSSLASRQAMSRSLRSMSCCLTSSSWPLRWISRAW